MTNNPGTPTHTRRTILKVGGTLALAGFTASGSAIAQTDLPLEIEQNAEIENSSTGRWTSSCYSQLFGSPLAVLPHFQSAQEILCIQHADLNRSVIWVVGNLLKACTHFDLGSSTRAKPLVSDGSGCRSSANRPVHGKRALVFGLDVRTLYNIVFPEGVLLHKARFDHTVV